MEDISNSNSDEGHFQTATHPFGSQSVEDWATSIYRSISTIVKASSSLKSEDINFYRSSDRDFSERLDLTATQVLGTLNNLTSYILGQNSYSQGILASLDQVTDDYDQVVDLIDTLLEKSDICLDCLAGRIVPQNQKKDPTLEQNNISIAEISGISLNSKSKDSTFKLIHARNIVRPQLKFKDAIDNSSLTLFKIKLTSKPNAMVPLGYQPDSEKKLDNNTLNSDAELQKIAVSASHPYHYEIENITYPPHLFEQRPEIMYKGFEKTKLHFVNTEEQLMNLKGILESVMEFAVDLEHHSYRSYQGFVCLMQISTREEDYIIDALELRHCIQELNTSFTDPRIVKVFHGAESDILWLQESFGVYVVNMFDTYHASHLLEMGSHSYAYLLQKYTQVTADKKYQLADWRIRPLPQEMIDYARSDTHYLLFIYDKMRNELLSRSNTETHNLLRVTLERSAQTCSQVYIKDVYDYENGMGPGGWANLLRKHGKVLTRERLHVFRALHAWRDQVARDQDESTRYVLPNHMLFAIVDKLPLEISGVLACCSPVPPIVRMFSNDIASLIGTALEEAATAPLSSLQFVAEPKEPQHSYFGNESDSSDEEEEMVIPEKNIPQVFRVDIVKVSRASQSKLFKNSLESMCPDSKKSQMQEVAKLVAESFALDYSLIHSIPTSKQIPPVTDIQVVDSASVKETEDASRQSSVDNKQNDIFVISEIKKKRPLEEASLHSSPSSQGEGYRKRPKSIDGSSSSFQMEQDTIVIDDSDDNESIHSFKNTSQPSNITPFDYEQVKSVVDTGARHPPRKSYDDPFSRSPMNSGRGGGNKHRGRGGKQTSRRGGRPRGNGP